MGGRVKIQAEVAHTAYEPLQAYHMRIANVMQTTGTCLAIIDSNACIMTAYPNSGPPDVFPLPTVFPLQAGLGQPAVLSHGNPFEQVKFRLAMSVAKTAPPAMPA